MNRPWMPLNIADYLRDTSHLRALESGAYLHLIMAYWVSGRLPNDDRQLATIAKLSDRAWKALRPCLEAFFGEGFSSHKRIDKELAKVAEISNKRRSAVEQREIKRRSNDTSSDDTLNTKHITKEESKDIRTVAKATRPPDEHFERFKAAYPKRKGGNPWKPAEKLFVRFVRTGVDPNDIISAARDGVGLDRDKIGTEFIPQAVKWLKDERFRDRPTAAPVVDVPGFYVVDPSPQMDAWLFYEREIGRSFPRDRNGGWHFPSEWPPEQGGTA